MREIINKLAQYDLSAEVIATSADTIVVPTIYDCQGYVIIALDNKHKQAFLNNQIDIKEVLAEE